MSRTTRLYLNDILKATDKIARFVESLDAETFKADELRSDSVLYNLMIIGEAVKSLPDDMKSEGVRWRDIARFRDRVVHHYFGTNLDIVWEIATVHVPVLRNHVENLIKQLDESESMNDPE